jgi:hypothetical protein
MKNIIVSAKRKRGTEIPFERDLSFPIAFIYDRHSERSEGSLAVGHDETGERQNKKADGGRLFVFA